MNQRREPRRLPRRGRVADTVAVILLCLLVAACGAADPETEAPTGSETTAGQADDDATETPADGGTFVTALGQSPPVLVRTFLSVNPVALVSAPVTESLIWLTPDAEVQPLLAESWEISEDGLEYVFALRQGVSWHDGESFDADDVVFSLQEILPLSSTGAALAGSIESVEALDSHTVRMTLTQPYTPALMSLSTMDFSILPEHLYADTIYTENPANLAPVGTGPFTFESFENEVVTLVRNEQYWGGAPAMERLVFTVMPDATSMVAALLNGEVDFVSSYELNFDQMLQLQSSEGVGTFGPRSAPSAMLGQPNHDHPALGEVAVRRALYQAVDLQFIADAVWNGELSPPRNAMPPAFGWIPVDDFVDLRSLYPYDPEAAANALDEAGFPVGADGHRFAVTITYRTDQSDLGAIAQILADNWRGIGIDVGLEQLESAVFAERVYTNRDFEFALSSLAPRVHPALGVTRAFACAAEPPVAYTNPTGYCNPELDELFANAASAPNVDAAVDAYESAVDILAEDLPLLNLSWTIAFDAANDSVPGIDEFFNSYGLLERWQELGR